MPCFCVLSIILCPLIPYSGKLLREKTFTNWWKIWFLRRKLSQIARFCSPKGHHAPNFAEKTFAYSHKTAKFTKVFSLESLLLYGTNARYTWIAHMMCDVQKSEGRLGRGVLLVNTWSEWIKSDFQLKCQQNKKFSNFKVARKITLLLQNWDGWFADILRHWCEGIINVLSPWGSYLFMIVFSLHHPLLFIKPSLFRFQTVTMKARLLPWNQTPAVSCCLW